VILQFNGTETKISQTRRGIQIETGRHFC